MNTDNSNTSKNKLPTQKELIDSINAQNRFTKRLVHLLLQQMDPMDQKGKQWQGKDRTNQE